MSNGALLSASGDELTRPAGIEADKATVPWYALHVRPRYEKLVARILRSKGFEEYLPLYKVNRRWSDRVMETELPLFPGYVFCQMDWTRRILPALTTPGVLRVLGVGRTPMPIDAREIEAVQIIVNSGRAVRPWPMPRIGERVCIEQGPLAGVEGVLVGVKKRSRLVVSVTLLKRSVAVEIESGWARPAARTWRDPVGSLRTAPN
jgi:transcription antitermination factor NusG